MNLHLYPGLAVLAWALLHFLWEGALIGLLVWVLLGLTRDRSPELRYLLAYGALAAMVLAFLATTCYLSALSPAGGLVVFFQVPALAATQVVAPLWSVCVRGWLEAALPGLRLAWGLGALLMLTRIGRGYWWLHSTCLKQAGPAGPLWEARLDRLVRTLVPGRRVRLRVCEGLDSPIVVGALRPMILLPLAVLTGMDGQALEAILAHELAHIRRHDYLANLLQAGAEVLFFFHPAFWWLSRRIRIERELCCDDAAVSCCGDALLYASALAGLEALRLPKPLFIHLAPAAKGGPLMLRIRRILSAETHPSSGSSPLPVLSALALLLALAIGGRGLQASSPAPAPQVVDFSKVKVTLQPKAPAYPPEAKANRIQGLVVVEVTLDTEGKPETVKATEGPEELHTTAEDYARQWRFKPFLHNGKPTAVRFLLKMPFKLR